MKFINFFILFINIVNNVLSNTISINDNSLNVCKVFDKEYIELLNEKNFDKNELIQWFTSGYSFIYRSNIIKNNFEEFNTTSLEAFNEAFSKEYTTQLSKYNQKNKLLSEKIECVWCVPYLIAVGVCMGGFWNVGVLEFCIEEAFNGDIKNGYECWKNCD